MNALAMFRHRNFKLMQPVAATLIKLVYLVAINDSV